MAASSSHAATQDKGKGPQVAPSAPPALHILNQVNDEVIDDPQLQWAETFIAFLGLAAWGALGIQELLRLSHFSSSTLPWMIRAATCFWNRTTNNFHLPCEMIDCTPNMQPKYHYNIAPTSSYSDFIAHHMGKEGTTVIDDERVAFLFYWLNAIIFCS
ncbi:hypothetical protein Ahy_B02g060393 isoform B [Arachis hypogaea]|uniref:Aminotransferase-like plant mobile domain-containing protein n=1 Tax=Arachis hypogaea TaxID=3818 RepID=A0A445AIC8_ARAHY|nr:hypothetical protein Ahy_B02g060393 isoform B [Arachis hypogaea]